MAFLVKEFIVIECMFANCNKESVDIFHK